MIIVSRKYDIFRGYRKKSTRGIRVPRFSRTSGGHNHEQKLNNTPIALCNQNAIVYTPNTTRSKKGRDDGLNIPIRSDSVLPSGSENPLSMLIGKQLRGRFLFNTHLFQNP